MALQKDRNDYEARLQKMLEESLINIDELKASSILDYNITPSKILPHIITVQQLRLEPMIGTKLYKKLQEPTLTFEYQLLLEEYVYNYLVHQALSDYLKTAGISAKEGGLYRHVPSDGDVLTLDETSLLSKNEDYRAAEYSKRMLQFIHDYDSYYPEFAECVGGGREAKGYRKILGGWNLYPSRPIINPNTNIDQLQYYIENVACGSCGFDEDLMTIHFYWGHNDIEDMGFDPNTLENSDNGMPETVIASPIKEYFWIVSDRDFRVKQVGTEIPYSSFNDTNPTSEIFVKGFQDDLVWYRIKVAEVYENPVRFDITV